MDTGYGFEEIGLPVGHAYPEVQFQPTIGTLVVRTRLVNCETPVHIYRLSSRHKNEISYHPICDMDDSKSVMSFSVCLSVPVLYYSVFEMSDGGNNWEGLYRYNLETAKADCVIRRSQFSPPQSEYWHWISKLYSVSLDGNKVICQFGKLSKKGGRVQYSVAEFCTISLQLVVLCEMAGPHA